jgi:hypothetical protein
MRKTLEFPGFLSVPNIQSLQCYRYTIPHYSLGTDWTDMFVLGFYRTLEELTSPTVRGSRYL